MLLTIIETLCIFFRGDDGNRTRKPGCSDLVQDHLRPHDNVSLLTNTLLKIKWAADMSAVTFDLRLAGHKAKTMPTGHLAQIRPVVKV